MKLATNFSLLISTFLGLLSFSVFSQEEEELIWYNSPAENWDNALPVGNGRLGAMVFGDPKKERIQLNEDSLWPGGPDWGNSKGNPEDLAKIRKLVKEGKLKLADSLMVERFSYKGVTRSHQTMGDLFIDYNHKNISDYRRQLNLATAIAESSFKADGYQFSQEVFSSAEDDVMVIHIKTSNPEGMDFEVFLDRPDDKGHKTVSVSSPNNDILRMEGMITQFGGAKNSEKAALDYGVKFETLLKANSNKGKISAHEGALKFENVDEVTLYLVCNTSFYDENYPSKNTETLKSLKNKDVNEIRKSHIKDYQKFYHRTSFKIAQKDIDSIPTDRRLEYVKDGKEDLGLIEKLFQYGRYLLISSSRPGTNPANLQGIWNEHIEAPWNADYHLNINLQMNYWPSGPANLSELQEPLFDLTDRLIERGKILAKEQYGMKGTVAHQTTDLWATPWMRAERANWGAWIHGGGWIAQHYWEHFQFTQDTLFLKERAYPALKSFAEFYADWLSKDPQTNKLVSFPETSPENNYINKQGDTVAISYGTTMGYQIMAEVFDNTIAASEIIGVENDKFIEEIKSKREKLTSGIEIGEDGRLLEWNEAFEEPEKGHRHISQLYALHPGDDITSGQPELFEAARKTIDYRLEHGGAGPGWSRAWIINYYARLLDAREAYKHIEIFMQRSIYPNLLDIHPPFQIDGNFGFTAGIAEMLLQSHEGFLRILPALPKEWANGEIKGLKARGNVEVDISWQDAKLTKLVLKSIKKQRLKVRYQDEEIEVLLEEGENKSIIF
ncbi:hypothetical protein APR41_01435 [Salegentibacter salinarum]|uniref:Uncharacterized protein n=1 Tax=Salegentibacter salinarum TaxID=447422 RepID=A0A2N0U443_9FLAO|nr:glycoside hydrolase family 95 protein [Salegentibacter salinarum]PKD21676.1 hypothetical protein APR41_01435 [Salegentibacter salinarum]SKB34987.1 alpha-L-fucosidase 2 [Salegentibacter salinarum]